MTPKGHRVLKGRRDLLYDPKCHGDVGCLCELVYDPKSHMVIRGRRDLHYDPKGQVSFHILTFDLRFDLKVKHLS